MNKAYNDIDALLNDVRKDIDNALMCEVLNAVKEIEIEHIQSEVYSVHQPTTYERRTSDGIDDPNNIVGTVNKGELLVDNITEFNTGYGTMNHGQGLDILINGGDGAGGYSYDYPFRIRVPYTDPRPFIDRTEEELDNSSKVENALEKGLRKRGLELL